MVKTTTKVNNWINRQFKVGNAHCIHEWRNRVEHNKYMVKRWKSKPYKNRWRDFYRIVIKRQNPYGSNCVHE